jgi:hypothetical protein
MKPLFRCRGMAGDEVPLTHEFLSLMLGIRLQHQMAGIKYWLSEVYLLETEPVEPCESSIRTMDSDAWSPPGCDYGEGRGENWSAVIQNRSNSPPLLGCTNSRSNVCDHSCRSGKCGHHVLIAARLHNCCLPGGYRHMVRIRAPTST